MDNSLKIRFQFNPTNPNRTKNAFAEFVDCKVDSIKGISGITQYEDEVEFVIEDKTKIQLPDFAVMHYLQFEANVEVTEKSKIILHNGENFINIPVKEITYEIKRFTVDENFSIDIFLHKESCTGKMTVYPNRVAAGDFECFKITYFAGTVPIKKGGKIRILSPYTSFSPPCDQISERFYYNTQNAKLSIEQAPYAFKIRGYVYDITIIEGEFKFGDSFTILHTDLKNRGVRVQNYIQSNVYFLGWEDNTGKGIFNPLALSDCAKFDVVSNVSRRIRIKTQQLIKSKETIKCEFLILDNFYNPTNDFNEAIEVTFSNNNKFVTKNVDIRNSRGYCEFEVLEEGFYIIEAKGGCLKTERISGYADDKIDINLYYGQLHAHSQVSDGTFTPEEYFNYGKNIGLLDFLSLTDHDWEIKEHARNKDLHKLEGLKNICNKYNKDSKFVTLIAYEWMGDEGHINVYFEDDKDLDLFSGNVSLLKNEKMYNTQKELLDCYKGRKDVILIPHISHGSNLDTFYEEREPAVEIYSMWGYSEYNSACRKNMPGFRDFLKAGRKFAFVGGADSHHGMPGQTGLNSKYDVLCYREGLTCVLSKNLTRSGIFNSIKDQNCYAVTGERILVYHTVEVNDNCIRVDLIVGGTDEIINIEVIGYNGVIYSINPMSITFSKTIEIIRQKAVHEFYYIKITQRDSEKAYLSLCNYV